MDLSNENASSLINEVGRFCPKLHCGRPEVWGAIAGVGGEVVPRWWLMLVGIAGILAGLLAFVWPDITAQVLLALIAAWAIMIGVLQIVGAIQLRKEIEGEWLLGLSGLLWILFGVALVAQPSPAQRGCGRGGLDDRFLRDRSRLRLHRAGVFA